MRHVQSAKCKLIVATEARPVAGLNPTVVNIMAFDVTITSVLVKPTDPMRLILHHA